MISFFYCIQTCFEYVCEKVIPQKFGSNKGMEQFGYIIPTVI